MMNRFIAHNMPKIELHCHLDGSMSLPLIQKLMQQEGKEPLGLEELREKLVAPMDCSSLAEYLEKFELPLGCLQTKEGLSAAAQDLALSAAKEQVKYLEVRFAPAFSVEQGLSVREILESVRDGLKKAEEKADILTGMIVCTMRNLETEKNIAMLKEAREFLGNGVVACDLAGDEKAYPTAAFADVFATAKKYGMPYTIHAGECGSREEIRTAIELGTSRIGHGIAMSGDEELKKEVAEKKIGVELCPTSNLQTKAVTDFTDYPFREFYDAGILLSINTDNRTVSDTSCTDEYMRLAEAGMFQEPMCEKIYMASLHSAFADDCSSEALTSLMASNNGVFSVISTEGGIFDIMAGRYSNKSNIDVWLKGHCGDAIYVDRMTREAECIMHPALSAILSIQPSVLDEIMSNTTMTGRGLIARFLYASPPSRIGSRVFRTQPIPPEVTAAYRSLIFRLMALPIDGDAHTVRLSEKAFDLMADYFQEHEKFLVGEGQAISDWASKYIGAVLRIAGLLHCADMEDDKAEVTASTMSKAIQIGKYFLAHSTYAYSMMGTDLAIQKAKFVLAKLKKKNVSAIKRSELFQMCRGKFFKKTEEIFPTLELLEGHGYIRLEEPERQSVGRPADVKIIVNPAA